MKILPNGIAVLEGDQWASRWIEEQGRLDYDPTISKVLEPLLKPGDWVVDVGAMLGAYTHGFLRAVGPTGHVAAYEPNPAAYDCLVHNCPDADAVMCGLGRKGWYGSLETNKENPGKCRIDLKPVELGGTFVMSLDECVENDPLHLLKIDVEGMEPDVIEGGIETIKRCRPIILIEINHAALELNGYTWQDVIDPLTVIGYKPKHLKEGLSFDREKCPEIDVLMMP